MSTIQSDWTRAEFKAYLLLYAAQSNYFESEEETELIHSLVSDDAYKRIHREIDKDNDYQRIQKIIHNIEKFEYSKDEIHLLVNDIQKLFLADGQIDLLESNFYTALKRLID
ncbi:MAG: hypothetical protein QNK23_18115 [Crocinitomicaceae bacterium]|nr:hypothetical protein [Crocinitomicaceae bacterium]